MPKLCYFCGSPATSREHLPPRQFFKGFECDSLTVNSCDSHNSQKSDFDTAIVAAFVVSIKNAPLAFPEIKYEQDIIAAISKAGEQTVRAKRLVSSKPIIIDSDNYVGRTPELAYLQGKVNIKGWVKQLTAGLVVHALKGYEYITNWDKALVWSFEYYEQEQLRLLEYIEHIQENSFFRGYFDSLPWLPGWSAHPRPYPYRVYRFEVCLGVNPSEMIFRHVFYDSYKWYVRFNSTTNVIDAVKAKLGVY